VNLLHVITTADVGGAEMHLLAQVRGQVERGHAVRVAYLLGKGTLRPDFLAAGAQEVTLVGKSPLALWNLRRSLRWCDVVHTHLLRADFLGALAATIWGKRSVLVSGKHNDERALQRPWVARLHGLIGRLPRRTIVLSEHVGRYMHTVGKLPVESMVCIYYGIDPAPFAQAHAERSRLRPALLQEFGWQAEDVVWICVARLAPQKAHDVLLQALRQAVDAWTQRGEAGRLRLWIVGDDPFGEGMARVRGWASEAGLLQDGSCVLTGIRRDVPALLAASDGFVMPSRWEGLGLVFLEAMAAGLPILATDVSAIPEVVLPRETGELVPVDDPQSLAETMVEWSRNPQQRARMGAAGQARVRTAFGLPTMVDRTLEVYRSLIPPRP